MSDNSVIKSSDLDALFPEWERILALFTFTTVAVSFELLKRFIHTENTWVLLFLLLPYIPGSLWAMHLVYRLNIDNSTARLLIKIAGILFAPITCVIGIFTWLYFEVRYGSLRRKLIRMRKKLIGSTRLTDFEKILLEETVQFRQLYYLQASRLNEIDQKYLQNILSNLGNAQYLLVDFTSKVNKYSIEVVRTIGYLKKYYSGDSVLIEHVRVLVRLLVAIFKTTQAITYYERFKEYREKQNNTRGTSEVTGLIESKSKSRAQRKMMLTQTEEILERLHQERNRMEESLMLALDNIFLIEQSAKVGTEVRSLNKDLAALQESVQSAELISEELVAWGEHEHGIGNEHDNLE